MKKSNIQDQLNFYALMGTKDIFPAPKVRLRKKSKAVGKSLLRMEKSHRDRDVQKNIQLRLF